ncbi:hypothetical protein SNEBB_009229 [Seison nebaliae]|nr:hypothetical protein SNEBB_009229 [Seison nebaliae]
MTSELLMELPAPERIAFLAVDLQTSLLQIVQNSESIVENANRLIKTAALIGSPLVVTEQYPAKLGYTSESIDITTKELIIEKTSFSAVDSEQLLRFLSARQIDVVVLFGLESHICILQTALALRRLRYRVYVIADACTSRNNADRMYSFQRMEKVGVVITTFEAFVMEIVRDKNHNKFKDISKLIKRTVASTGL